MNATLRASAQPFREVKLSMAFLQSLSPRAWFPFGLSSAPIGIVPSSGLGEGRICPTRLHHQGKGTPEGITGLKKHELVEF